MNIFNVRVYGILIDKDQRLLISDEFEHEKKFTKLPGGGLEFGEGLIEALKREFLEECTLPVEIIRHFYTTDFFVKSIFNDSQVISVYYLIKALEAPAFKTSVIPFDFTGNEPAMQSFRWVNLAELEPLEMTFETEQYVIKLLKNDIQKHS